MIAVSLSQSSPPPASAKREYEVTSQSEKKPIESDISYEAYKKLLIPDVHLFQIHECKKYQ